MNQIRVDSAQAHKTEFLGQVRLYLTANGMAPTSGWSSPYLAPRYTTVVPADGVWEFDFLASPPHGMVLQVLTPIAAAGFFTCPDWVKKIRICAANEIEVDLAAKHGPEFMVDIPCAVTQKGVLWKREIASFDDSFNIIGHCGGLSIKMKKLHHTLTVVVNGPDEAAIRRCFDEAMAAGVIAAIVAAFITGGAALSAAIGAFLSQFGACLGGGYTITMDDRSEWIEWCT
ncbi:hypothetical protein DVDV_1819 [Desulfovibrio sp. DV]|uniref:hypothetical protein n=1 Tax=Desulfovibrio sp. DV TaxID=1844708 RepID=UPI00094B98DE|nr:hypothetical protein [Desulfovibrio sp. DV]OLN27959.1 hypothetical protein DVDV_1819 [Desulfovibrio sp. DV]